MRDKDVRQFDPEAFVLPDNPVNMDYLAGVRAGRAEQARRAGRREYRERVKQQKGAK